jgi:hypothetical protein
MPSDLQNSPDAPPAEEYARRLETRRAAAGELDAAERRLSNYRLAAVLGGLLVAWLAFGARAVSPWWLALPVGAFVLFVLQHDRAIHAAKRARRAVRFYEEGLARLEHRWAGKGNAGERYLDPAHPYAADLDLFGRGSLFERLCAARTRAGEEVLARWLLSPADAETVRSRQAAVADLRPRLDLREDLAILGEQVGETVDVEGLKKWAAAPLELTSGTPPLIAAILSLATVAGAAAWALGYGWQAFALLFLAGQAYSAVVGAPVRRALRALERPARDLEVLALLLARLEREEFGSPRLAQLSADLRAAGQPPSERLARLRTLVGLLEAQRNAVFAPVGLILLWSLQMAHRIEGWRAENGAALLRWIDVISELEALSSLAGYAYERPNDPFPEVRDGGRCFAAEDLAHPLLPDNVAVPNSLRLDESVRLFIISGSNMSGKSTLMRSAGTNTVLALAGAPVRARSLRLSPLQVGASIRIQDSLQGGISRFQAEILRLRQIVDLTGGEYPLFYLLDEILHGTNSHDRRIGAEAVLRSLVERGAVGLTTTHDLALARMVDDPALHAVNVHFEDHMEAGKMAFDYRLRPGVVTKSNALELMRAIGLKV